MVGKPRSLVRGIRDFGGRAIAVPGKIGKWTTHSWSKLSIPQKRVVAAGLVAAGIVTIAAVKYNKFAEVKAKWNALKGYQKAAIVAGALAAGYGVARYYKGAPLTKYNFRGVGF